MLLLCAGRALALSLSSAPFLLDTTVYYTFTRARTHAREHQPVWFALIRTGLDWTGLNRAAKSIPLGFESCSAVQCRMSAEAEVEAASRALESEQEFWDGMCTCHWAL